MAHFEAANGDLLGCFSVFCSQLHFESFPARVLNDFGPRLKPDILQKLLASMLRRTLFSMTMNNSLTPLFVMLVIIEKGGVAKGRRGTVDLLIAGGLERHLRENRVGGRRWEEEGRRLGRRWGDRGMGEEI